MTEILAVPSTETGAGPGASDRTPMKASSGPRRSRYANDRVTRVLVLGALCAAAFYFLLPIYWLLISATKTRSDLTSGSPFWFGEFALWDNLHTLITVDNGHFVRWALNSLIYSVGGATVGTLVSAMTGYALAVFVFRGRGRLFELVLAGVLMPTTALSLPLFLLFSQVQLTDTIWAVLLPSFVSPFGVYLARIYASEGVPTELVEAARIDGASEVRIFFEIATRLMTPALVTIFLIQFVGSWNDFFLPRLVLQDPNLWPVTVGLYSWNIEGQRIPGMLSSVVTGSAVSVVPLILIFLLLQRYLRSGLAAGSLR